MKIFKEVSLADSLTVLNALFGFSSITYLLLYGLRIEAFILFYLSVFADGIDGFIASKTEKSPFGKELDSLADSVSFGLFPAASIVVFDPNLFPAAALCVAFSILRLARFNTLQHEDFLGVPTVVSALLITSLIRIEAGSGVIAILVIASSVLMISDLPYPRIRDAVALIVVALLILASVILNELSYLILLIALIYMISPIPGEVLRWLERRRIEKQLLKRE
jgi:CDP-diacylglycerol--serine O-phosphatidyltransferase